MGRREYFISPKPIQFKVNFRGSNLKNILYNIWLLIKELFNREYRITSNLDWKSDEGRELDILLIAYNQLIAEEEKRIHDEMDKKVKK